ncbi:Ring-15 protein [Apiospora sp. TS-2023a]
MNSNSLNLGGKSLSASSSSFNYTPSQPVSVPSPSHESNARRSASSTPSAPTSVPRKGQAARKQHREKRRPLKDSRLDDDDAMAELVSYPVVLPVRGGDAPASRLPFALRLAPGTGNQQNSPRAFRNPSSRRGQTSITHLLNFSTRPFHEQGYGHGHGRSSRRHATWGPGSGYHPVDKAKFVHANYRFIVSPTGDYTAQAGDANKHVDWSDVLQVLASTESQSTSCPICLSDPVAPRMARCGHIFCFPCLLRFMNSTSEEEPSSRKEARWKKCPICEDSFKLAETRPVRFYAGQENPLPRPGEDVVLRLMMRETGSTLALPREGGPDVMNIGEDVPWHFAANVLDYAHIMKGTNDYVAEQYDREVEDLRRQANEDEHQFGTEDGDWTVKAVRAITTAKDKIREQKSGVSDEDAAGPLAQGLPKTLAKQPAGGPTFFFYTAPPHLYLSPLDIRILKTQFGDFSNFPSTLLPRVEHVSAGHVVDDAMRKRAKYLGHLPFGCVVSFLECDWTDIVPSEVLDTFSGDLERRRKAHRDKAAQEERERVQAERQEAAAIGRSARRHFDEAHVDTFESGPAVNIDDFQPLAPAPGSTPPNPRLGFDQLADISTSPSTSKTVWGTRVLAASPSLDPVSESSADDGWLKADHLLEQAQFDMQMEALSLEESNAGPSNSGAGSATPGGGGGNSGGGKKKKKQKITLMSTGGRRGN